MNFAIIGYPNSVNLGDWIQSLIITFIWKNIVFEEIDREQLHAYNGPKIQLICNGWFMENPKHWPPSDAIHPLFISFHINPTVKNEFTKQKVINYFKKYEPIGCRDDYTLHLLRSHGVKAYFSGCLTLCYDQSYLSLDEPKPKPSGILVASAFDRLKPSVQLSCNPVRILHQLIKYPIKSVAYWVANNRLKKVLRKSNQPITFTSQVIDTNTLRNRDPKILALNHLRKIASAELVITSRIHTALPATAMGVPVLFLSDGLDHINHRSRLGGLLNYFESCASKQLRDIDLNEVKSKSEHIDLSTKIRFTIDGFLNEHGYQS